MKPRFSTKLPQEPIYHQERSCPLFYVWDIIGPKWRLPIIGALYEAGPLRYNELKRTVVGITNLMLTQSLRELERHRVVTRIVYDDAAPHVEYALTDRGKSLVPALNALYEWGEKELQDNGQRE